MKLLLVLVTIGLAGAAAYFGTLAKSSYSSYSTEQLQTLEKGMDQLAQPTEEQAYSRVLLEAEKQRRLLFPGLAIAAVLAAIGAYILKPARESFAPSSAEEARFSASIGNPLLVLEGARNKAATLLGVTVHAPPAVIEAALAAQLQSRDPSKMDGLAPDLKAMALSQRDELIKARDLLMQKHES